MGSVATISAPAMLVAATLLSRVRCPSSVWDRRRASLPTGRLSDRLRQRERARLGDREHGELEGDRVGRSDREMVGGVVGADVLQRDVGDSVLRSVELCRARWRNELIRRGRDRGEVDVAESTLAGVERFDELRIGLELQAEGGAFVIGEQRLLLGGPVVGRGQADVVRDEIPRVGPLLEREARVDASFAPSHHGHWRAAQVVGLPDGVYDVLRPILARSCFAVCPCSRPWAFQPPPSWMRPTFFTSMWTKEPGWSCS